MSRYMDTTPSARERVFADWELLSLRQLAQVVGLAPATMQKYADTGLLPIPIIQHRPRGKRFVRARDARIWADVLAGIWAATIAATPKPGERLAAE